MAAHCISSIITRTYFINDAIGILGEIVRVNIDTEMVQKEAVVGNFAPKFDFSTLRIKAVALLVRRTAGIVFC
jgi:hypothetical protein